MEDPRKTPVTAGITAAIWPLDGPAPAALPGSGATLRQVHIKAGHVATRHSHPHEQFLLVLAGAGRLEHEGGSLPLHPGTTIHLPPEAWHSAEFMADTVLVEFNLEAAPGLE